MLVVKCLRPDGVWIEWLEEGKKYPEVYSAIQVQERWHKWSTTGDRDGPDFHLTTKVAEVKPLWRLVLIAVDDNGKEKFIGWTGHFWYGNRITGDAQRMRKLLNMV